MYYKRLKEIREDRDYTQKEIAIMLNMKTPQYNRYERGIREIPTHILKQLCLIYKVSADYILELPAGLNWYRNS